MLVSLLMSFAVMLGLTGPCPIYAGTGTPCPDCGGTGKVHFEHVHDNMCEGYIRIEGGEFTPELAKSSSDCSVKFSLGNAQNGDRLIVEQWYYLSNSSASAKLPRFVSDCDILTRSGSYVGTYSNLSGLKSNSFPTSASEYEVHADRVCYIRSGEFDPSWTKLDRFLETYWDEVPSTDIAGWKADTGNSVGFWKGTDRYSIYAPLGVAGCDEQIYAYASMEIVDTSRMAGLRQYCYFDTGFGKKLSTNTASVAYMRARWSVWRRTKLCGLSEGEGEAVCETCRGMGVISEEGAVEHKELEQYDSPKESPVSDYSCVVEADIGSHFTITIPKRIVLDSGGRGEYLISFVGDLKGLEYVSVEPKLDEGAIILHEKGGKADVRAAVTQSGSIFRLQKEGTLAGCIEAPISAGEWSGGLEFLIALNTW